MSRQDDWDDDYDRGPGRGRGRADTYDDYDDRGRRGGGCGGMVLGSAITTLAAGAIILILGILVMIAGFNDFSGLAQLAELERAFGGGMRMGGLPGVGRIRFIAIMEVINGILSLGVGGLCIAAGIGLLLKKGFGRTLGLIGTFVACGLVVLEIVRLIPTFGLPNTGGRIAFAFIIMVLAIGMIVFNMIVLFSAQTKRLLR